MTSAFQGVMATIERIETERLVGERIEQHHRPLVRRMYQNRTVCATLGGILSDQMIDRTMVSNLDHWDRHGFGIWIFSHKDDDAFVGRAGLRRVEIEGRPEIELAYTVMPEHWNQGYATEMSRRLLSIAFRKLRFPDVACFTLTTNFASQRVMEKLGFVFEREGLHANLDHVFYRLAAQIFHSAIDFGPMPDGLFKPKAPITPDSRAPSRKVDGEQWSASALPESQTVKTR